MGKTIRTNQLKICSTDDIFNSVPCEEGVKNVSNRNSPSIAIRIFTSNYILHFIPPDDIQVLTHNAAQYFHIAINHTRHRRKKINTFIFHFIFVCYLCFIIKNVYTLFVDLPPLMIFNNLLSFVS